MQSGKSLSAPEFKFQAFFLLLFWINKHLASFLMTLRGNWGRLTQKFSLAWELLVPFQQWHLCWRGRSVVFSDWQIHPQLAVRLWLVSPLTVSSVSFDWVLFRQLMRPTRENEDRQKWASMVYACGCYDICSKGSLYHLHCHPPPCISSCETQTKGWVS